jgi:tetratricopeptide (TPR) repeat protein
LELKCFSKKSQAKKLNKGFFDFSIGNFRNGLLFLMIALLISTLFISILLNVSVFAQQREVEIENIPDEPFEAGLHYFRLADYDQAIIEFNRSIEQNPKHIDSHYYLGFCYLYKGNDAYQSGRIGNAYSYYRKSYSVSDTVIDLIKEKIAEDGPSYNQYFRLGYIYEIRSAVPFVKEYDLAQEYYEKALEFAEPYLKPSVFLRIGLLWYNQEKYEEAIQYLEEGREISSGDINLLYYLGLCYEKIGDSEKAVYYFNELIDIAPNTGLASQAREEIKKIER